MLFYRFYRWISADIKKFVVTYTSVPKAFVGKIGMDEVLKDFLTESHECLDLIDVGLANFRQDPGNVDLLHTVFRLVHTMKGTCGFLNLPRLEALSHAAESMIYRFRLDSTTISPHAVTLVLKSVESIKYLLSQIESQGGVEPAGDDSLLIAELEEMAAGPAGSADAPVMLPGHKNLSQSDLDRLFDDASDVVVPVDPAQPPSSASKTGETTASRQTLRVKVASLEQLVSTVTDLITTRAHLLEIARRSDDYELKTAVNRLADIASQLQKIVVDTRVQPIGSAWRQLLPMTQNLAVRLGKDIALVLDGEAIEVDRQIIDLIKAPLAHMVRNSADHGLETPEARLALGKPAQGTIGVTAVRHGSDIVIEVLDDGQGLNTNKIKQKALALGLINDADYSNMEEAEAAQLIFEPGLSTCEAVTRLSGRGVGLDVACSSIETIGGSIRVHSVPGEGTVFVIKIPVTPAQISSLILARTRDDEKIVLNKAKAGLAEPSSPSPSLTDEASPPKQASLPGPDTKVLFLEENPFFKSMLTPAIEAGGYDVTVVGSVSEALESLQADAPFLAIVCDLDAPDKSGFLLAKRVKENLNWTNIPLVAVSSLASSLSKDRAVEAGFDHCLAKFDRSALRSCLNQITYRLKVAA